MIMMIHCCHINHIQGTTLISIKKSFFWGSKVFIIVFTQEVKAGKQNGRTIIVDFQVHTYIVSIMNPTPQAVTLTAVM